MASAEDFEDVLSCSICLDILDDPKVLPCSHGSHVFCRHCLQPLVTGDDTVTCPECREVHPVPGGGAKNLITDLRMKKLIETCLCADCRKFDQFCKPCEKCGVKSCPVCICSHDQRERCVLLEKLRRVTESLPNQPQRQAMNQLEENWENFRRKNTEQRKESDLRMTRLIDSLQQKKSEVLKVYDDYDQYARDRITNIQQMKQIKNLVQGIRNQINDLNAVKESLASLAKYEEIVSEKGKVLSEVIPDRLGVVFPWNLKTEISHFASPITRRQAGNDADVELVFSEVGDVREYEKMSSFSSSKVLAEGNIEIYRHQGGRYHLQVVDENDKNKILKEFVWNNRIQSAYMPTVVRKQFIHAVWSLKTGEREVLYSTRIADSDRRCAVRYVMVHASVENKH